MKTEERTGKSVFKEYRNRGRTTKQIKTVFGYLLASGSKPQQVLAQKVLKYAKKRKRVAGKR